MSINKYHLIQEIDGISPDDVVITQVEQVGNNIKICWSEYDDRHNCLMECEHIILGTDNKPSEQKNIIIVTEQIGITKD